MRGRLARSAAVTALAEAMAEQCVSSATLVTRTERGSIDTEAGTIDVVPAWRFLLDQDPTPEPAPSR